MILKSLTSSSLSLRSALAVALRMDSACCSVRLGFTAAIRDTRPATCGAAMLVPLFWAYVGWVPVES